eukprot:scaffold128275_cov27-Phaeocystis_antarctica.AAC.3
MVRRATFNLLVQLRRRMSRPYSLELEHADQPPGTSFEQPGRAPPPAAKEGTSRALLDRAGLEQRGWPAPTRHAGSTVTDGLGRALVRLTQP